jgi:hypothetical protein
MRILLAMAILSLVLPEYLLPQSQNVMIQGKFEKQGL